MRELEVRLVLFFEPIFNALVQLFVPSCCLGRIQVASADDMEIRGSEIEGGGDDVKIAIRYKLERKLVR